MTEREYETLKNVDESINTLINTSFSMFYNKTLNNIDTEKFYVLTLEMIKQLQRIRKDVEEKRGE